MSYDSPSNNLDNNEICKYLELSNKLNVIDLIKKIWKDGFEWGYQLGYEENEDIISDYYDFTN